MNPPLDILQARIPQKYELVLSATRRAKQILRQQQLNAAQGLEDEVRQKPLSLALMEIAEGRVGVEQLNEPDITADFYEDEQQDFFPELDRFHRDDEGESLEDGADDEDDEDMDEDDLEDEDEEFGVEGDGAGSDDSVF